MCILCLSKNIIGETSAAQVLPLLSRSENSPQIFVLNGNFACFYSGRPRVTVSRKQAAWETPRSRGLTSSITTFYILERAPSEVQNTRHCLLSQSVDERVKELKNLGAGGKRSNRKCPQDQWLIHDRERKEILAISTRGWCVLLERKHFTQIYFKRSIITLLNDEGLPIKHMFLPSACSWGGSVVMNQKKQKSSLLLPLLRRHGL